MEQNLSDRAQAIDILVGERLKEIRKSLQLSQVSMAKAVGVSFQQVQKYERGTNRMSISTLTMLCEAIGIHPFEFLAPLYELASAPANGDIFARLTEAETALEQIRQVVSRAARP
ncbi:helix-turn-helix transcriptional regulator [Rhizobium sp. Root1220]|uniref:helix-turn-helix domain-containing protein n=1 Tax=Rhizobium sp. Root1220 TaxID=1736432 RepID=UPI0006F9551F|nr:helix-turn-helix transcriptional regulator [Rhizobium sp. Root1220]KQV78166.1 hypothetical protein ASC90_26950 [Rhizobium sp. Root1220]